MNLVGTTDHEFLAELERRASAVSPGQFIYVATETANRLQKLNGEGEYTHNRLTHGFQREQLLNLIEVALNRMTGGAYKTLNS